jgi:hypothetical protein
MSAIRFCEKRHKSARRQEPGMHWTDDDGDDVSEAIAKMRAAVACLDGDLVARRARPVTRRALDAAMQALLALDDVYFEDEHGGPVPAAWKRARELLRKG